MRIGKFAIENNLTSEVIKEALWSLGYDNVNDHTEIRSDDIKRIKNIIETQSRYTVRIKIGTNDEFVLEYVGYGIGFVKSLKDFILINKLDKLGYKQINISEFHQSRLVHKICEHFTGGRDWIPIKKMYIYFNESRDSMINELHEEILKNEKELIIEQGKLDELLKKSLEQCKVFLTLNDSPYKYELFNNSAFNHQNSLITYNARKLITRFNDSDAINLCKKMIDGFSRNLVLKYEKSGNNNPELLFQLHFIANKAFDKFGEKVIAFMLSLKTVAFKGNTKLYSTYDEVNPNFPACNIKNDRGDIILTFYNNNSERAFCRAFIRSKGNNRNQFEEIGYVSEVGYLIHRLESHNPHFFILKTIKEEKFGISSGVITGKCDGNCGHELTDPVSLIIGYGKRCAERLGIQIPNSKK
jgi:hypothetical protein